MNTKENGVLTGWSLYSTIEAGILRIEEGDFSASAMSVSSAAAATVGKPDLTYEKSRTQNVTVHEQNKKTIKDIQGRNCRVLSSDSAPPPGLGMFGGAEMQQQREAMAAASVNANAQISAVVEQMKAQGATDEQIAAVAGITQVFQLPQAESDDNLHVRPLGSRINVFGHNADEFMVTTAAGEPRFRIAVVDEDKLPGGRRVKQGMISLVDTYGTHMENMMGAEVPMGESLTVALTSPVLTGKFPVSWVDLRTGEENYVVSSSNEDLVKVEYENLRDTEKDMFEMESPELKIRIARESRRIRTTDISLASNQRMISTPVH